MADKLKQEQAYAYYLALGPDRALKTVSRRFMVPEKKVKQWEKESDWKNRIIADSEEIDARMLAKLPDPVRIELAKAKESILMICCEGIRQFNEKLNTGEISITKVKDFETLVKTYLLVNGQPTNIRENLSSGAVGKAKMILEMVQDDS